MAAPRPAAVARALRRSPVATLVADRTRTRRSVRTIQASGLFDEAWYRGQLDDGERPDDAIAHYVEHGAARGLQPHPLFDPAHHLAADRSARRSSADPFTHLLAGGGRRPHDTHPLFDAGLVAERAPEARQHPAGPFGWYLADPDRAVPPPTALLTADQAPTPRAYVDLVRTAVERHRAVVDHTSVARTSSTFDHDGGARHVAAMARTVAALDPRPLVSVIVPTKDRATTLALALDSVLAQSYRDLELLVVDDGSTDETPELLAGYAARDPRVRPLRRDRNGGVSAARNAGLEAARGELVTYLDSDNTWVPEFVETMVGTLRTTGARAAYAGSELRGEDRVAYRGRPFDREVLRERNHIDCITLVHERSLLDEVGGFDERLRRVVDWDLLIRLSDVTDLVYAPFIATSYDLWDEGGERISNDESVGYRYEVRAKHLIDWAGAPALVAGRTSVVAVTAAPDPEPVAGVARTVAAHLDGDGRGGDVEVVVVDNGTTVPDALQLRLLEAARPGLRVERVPDRLNRTTAIDLGASLASGDVLVVADPVLDVAASALEGCAAAVREGTAVAAQPTFVNLDGTVASAGTLTAADGALVAVGDGLAVHDAVLTAGGDRDALDPFGYAVDAARFRALGGLAPLLGGSAADVDLGRRLRGAGGRLVALPATTRLDAWPAIRRHLPTHDDGRELARRGGSGAAGSFERHLEAAGQLAVDGWVPSPPPRFSYRGPQRWAPAYVRRTGSRRRWAIKVSAPDVAEHEAWGDWHFGVALRDALEAAGEHAVVDLRRGWYRASSALDDVDVVIRGTQRYEPPPGRTSLLWVISHPDALRRDEVATHDGVFVASAAYVTEAERRWGRPVEALLQATDPDRFHPGPDPALTTEVLFVGNSRGVRRRIVADAIEAGLEPAIYGAGWDGLVPAHLVRATHVPNDQLGRYYASAEVVLADHWDDMRERGFVANRLFDAVASGAAVVSDDVAGIGGLFGDAVRTYREPSELAGAVEAARAWRRAGGRPTASGHTFADRAARLVAWVDEHAASRS